MLFCEVWVCEPILLGFEIFALISWHAGVAALILLISYADQVHDTTFSHKGALKGPYKLLDMILQFIVNPNSLWIE